jgi:SAM-dependent methyltransferase
MSPELSPQYWDNVAEKTKQGAPIDAWRAYMRYVYGKLIVAWLPDKNSVTLKTDLFEEAISAQGPLSDLGNRTIGLDQSLAVVQAAQHRFTQNGHRPEMLVCDLRNVALRTNSVGRILSGSSLDHFEKQSEFSQALSELARVLAPGGVMVLTLDNPLNPIVWLRNHLPFHLLNHLGVVPYFVGKTCSAKEGKQQLEHLGLEVTDVTAVAHAPRAPAIFLTWIGERLKWNSLSVIAGKMMQTFEILQRWPTRYVTGYYTAFRAVKPLQ